MAKAGELIIDLAANVARLQKDMREATNVVSRASKQMEGAAGAVKTALGALGFGVSTALMVSFTRAAVDAADQMGKLSQKVGVSVESLSALDYAAKLSDVSTEALSTGLKQLNKSIDEDDEALKRLGISLTDASGRAKSTETILGEVADAFAGMEDGAGKTKIAMDLFGKSGADLIPLLNQGRAGLADMTAEARALGIVLSEEDAKAAEEFNDNMTRLNLTMQALARDGVGPLIGGLAGLAGQFLAATKAGASFAEALRVADFGGAEQLGRNIFKTRQNLARWKQMRADAASRGKPTGDFDLEIGNMERELELMEKMQAGSHGFQELPRTKGSAPVKPESESDRKRRLKDEEQARDKRIKSAIDAAKAEKQYHDDVEQMIADTVKMADDAHEKRVKDAIDAAKAEADHYQRREDEILHAIEAGNEATEDMKDKHKKAIKEMTDAIEGFGRATSRTFAEMLVDGEFTSEGLKSVFRSFFIEMIEQQLYKGVFGPIFDAVGGAIFGAGKATGGPVSPGVMYPVGETGPEFFMPSVAGSIVPADQMGGHVTLVQNIRVDARSDMQTVYAAARMGGQQAKAEIMRSMQRNGAFAKATR